MFVKTDFIQVVINGKNIGYKDAEFKATDKTLVIKEKVNEDEYISVYLMDKIDSYCFKNCEN